MYQYTIYVYIYIYIYNILYNISGDEGFDYSDQALCVRNGCEHLCTDEGMDLCEECRENHRQSQCAFCDTTTQWHH